MQAVDAILFWSVSGVAVGKEEQMFFEHLW